jgi:hypothetical protein
LAAFDLAGLRAAGGGVGIGCCIGGPALGGQGLGAEGIDGPGVGHDETERVVDEAGGGEIGLVDGLVAGDDLAEAERLAVVAVPAPPLDLPLERAGRPVPGPDQGGVDGVVTGMGVVVDAGAHQAGAELLEARRPCPDPGLVEPVGVGVEGAGDVVEDPEDLTVGELAGVALVVEIVDPEDASDPGIEVGDHGRDVDEVAVALGHVEQPHADEGRAD